MKASVLELLRKASGGTVRSSDSMPPEHGWIWDEPLGNLPVRGKRIRQWLRIGEADANILPWINLNPAGNDIQNDRGEKQLLRTKTENGGYNVTGWNMVKCSWRWGFDGCVAYNLFPPEDPDPTRLSMHVRRIGSDFISGFQQLLVAEIVLFDALMASWGNKRIANKTFEALLPDMRSSLVAASRQLEFWAISNGGEVSPRHPRTATNEAKPKRYLSLS